MPIAARPRLIAALDLASAAEAGRLVQQLSGEVSFFKVGLELYTAAGMAMVDTLLAAGHRVFLDLKLFDVPETVKRATRIAAARGISFLTVHEGGATVAAAVEAAASVPGSRLQILAVTVLTSMDAGDLREMGIDRPVEALVLDRARRARAAGAAGVVASPQEAAALKRAFPDLTLVTPGIRPAGAEAQNQAGDQKRLATPAAAIAAGADYLVVGRPIKSAPDPAAAARAIIAEMQSAFDLHRRD